MRRKGDVLITRFSALGDVAMTLPIIYDACRANPDRQFIFMTKPHPAGLFINTPDNLSVYTPELNRYKGLTGLIKLYRDIRRRYPDIDTYIDLHDVLRTKVLRPLFSLSGARISRLDKRRRARRALTKNKAKHLTRLIPVAEAYREAFSKVDIPTPKHFISLYDDRTPLIKETSIGTKPADQQWIAVAPFARHQGKIYPPQLLGEVLDLLRAPGRRILIFGFGEQEAAIIDGWCRNTGDRVNMARMALGTSAELPILAQCDAMLSMDSANMHIAGLVGLPVVSIWGATHPFTGFAGRTAGQQDMVQLNMVCRPCSIYGNQPCRHGDYHCLAGIKPKRVAQAVENLLSRTSIKQ